MRLTAIATLCLATAAGCRTTSQTTNAITTEAVVSTGRVSGMWQVLDGERAVGFVVRFEDVDAPERTFFSVRNERHQELGLIDRLGRAFRYRPHEREPEWLGTGTVLDGAQRILGAGTRIAEVPGADADVDAAHRPIDGAEPAPPELDHGAPDPVRDDV